MKNKDLYNVVGGIAKTILSDLVDKAIESSKQVGDFIDDEIKPKFDSSPETETTQQKKLLNETELMQAFIEQYDSPITPSWDRSTLSFVDENVNREFIMFKNGYLLWVIV